MKTKRNLSGIYVRYQNPETTRWENWCFEDLPVEKQDECLSGRPTGWIEELAKQLANTLNNIGEQFDIMA